MTTPPSSLVETHVLALLREAADEGCENYRNGYHGCDSVDRQVADLRIDRFKPCEASTYHPVTGRYKRCLSCRIKDYLATIANAPQCEACGSPNRLPHIPSCFRALTQNAPKDGHV